ncbi:MAG TPA: EthD family reductase, partial [Candidatus Binataceae bacterium]|nr:EthD family reductase [Candidatus Binataceae bacterium]
TGMIHRRIVAETIVPFDSRRAGQTCFVMAAEFDLAIGPGGAPEAEDHYLNVHTKIARRLPGLRHYLIGKLQPERGAAPERYRMAVLTFDTRDGLRGAYASEVGQELTRDEQATIRNGRVWRLDARVEL